jgi:hypothetical protein
MSEIAFNISGEPFDPPPATAAWRVRKLKSKGAPEVVYARDGLPLFLPLDADIEELRREVLPPSDGRYRLDPGGRAQPTAAGRAIRLRVRASGRARARTGRAHEGGGGDPGGHDDAADQRPPGIAEAAHRAGADVRRPVSPCW